MSPDHDDWFNDPEMQAAALEGWMNNPVRPIVEAGEGITVWLLARIEEDERVARAAGGLQINLGSDRLAPGPRMLAECEAKRRIIAVHRPIQVQNGSTVAIDARFPATEVCECCANQDSEHGWDERAGWPCVTIMWLARPFADRPGYREEWRP